MDIRSGLWTVVVCFPFIVGRGGTSRKGSGKQKLVIFTSIVEPPFLKLRDDERGGMPYEGFIPDLIRKLARSLRVPYTIEMVKDGGYGRPTGNGTWNGMIGEILRGEATVAAGALSKRPAREEVVDFTEPFITVGIKAVFKRPIMGETLPVTSIRELANQTDVSYGVIDGSMTMWYFRGSRDPDLKNMWTKMSTSEPSGLERSSKDGIERVRRSNGSFVFFLESTFADYLIGHKPCNLVTLNDKELLNPNEYAFAVGKGSPLLKELNNAIKSLKKKGEIARLYRKWWNGDCRRSKSKRLRTTTEAFYSPTPLEPLRDEPERATKPSWLRSQNNGRFVQSTAPSSSTSKTRDGGNLALLFVLFLFNVVFPTEISR